MRAAGLCAAVAFGLIVPIVPAQQPANPGQSGPPTQPGAGPGGTSAAPDDALDNPLLDKMDEEDNVTYMDSHVVFRYRYDAFDGGVDSNQIQLKWQQAIGPTKRAAVSIELPYVHISEPENQSTGGFGDMKLELRGMLQKREKWEQALGVELTLPSASNVVLGEEQTVLRFIWGFSAELAKKTVLSGECAYNKAIVNHGPEPGVNSVEPELILMQGFSKRFGAYLDWDNYYEFSVDKYINTMKIGLEFALDKKEKWGLEPFVVLPLSHASSVYDTKVGAGVDLTYAF